MTAVWAIVIALSLLVLLLGMLIVGLLRSHADILRRLDSLGAGLEPSASHDHGQITLTNKPEMKVVDQTVTGITPDGEPLVASLTSGSDPTLVAFLSTTCTTCTPFWEGLEASVMRFGGHRHRVVIVTLGESEESPTRAQSLRTGSVDVIMSSEGWAKFEVPGAPYFALIEPESGAIIGEGSAMTFESLEEFLTDATNDQRWDLEPGGVSEESRIDTDLKNAGIHPGDPRLYPEKGDVTEDDT